MVEVSISESKVGVFVNQNKGKGILDSPRFKVGYLTLPDTTDDSDTTTINVYEQFGITRVLAVTGWTHSTTDSVIIEEAPTTSVVNNNLTITVGGSTDNKKRFFIIYGI